MRKTDAFRRAAALMAALSITVSLAAPAFAETYYIDYGNITITKDEYGKQTVQQGSNAAENIGDDEEIIITTVAAATTTLESDLEGPAAEDSGFGPVVEDNYQPAAPAQPEDAEEPKDADQPEDDDQKKSTEESEDANRPENAEESEDTDRQKSAEEQESAGQQPQPQQAAPTSVNGKGNGVFGNTITVINNAAKALKLTLKDVKIDVSDTGGQTGIPEKAALSVQGKGNVEIELDGDNVLKSATNKAGLEKNESDSTGMLTLKDDKEPGSLKAEGGTGAAGIGGSENNGTNNITISGGTVKAIGGPQSAGIGGGNDFRTHGVRSNREVQATETARHGHTVQSGFYHGVEVLLGAAGIFHTAVGTVGTFFVHALGIGSDNLSGNLSGDFKYLVKRVHSIRIVLRGIVILVFVLVTAFFQFADTFHHRVVQMILQFGNFGIKICHNFLVI